MNRVVDLIVGARPNFMKIAPIVDAFRAAASRGGHLNYRLIHTGQHYDHAMSRAFFDDLGIPAPDLNLEVGSGTAAEQTGAIMVRYEQVLAKEGADLCLVVGDVTSTMACAIVARKFGVPVAHVEGGLRSNDWSMPEEINRVVTDAITNWFFTTTENAGVNLRESGVADDRIFFVGNTMIDTLVKHMAQLRPPGIARDLRLAPGAYVVVTLHRPSNVDDVDNLLRILKAISHHTAGMPVVFPVHPRTAGRWRAIEERLPNVHHVEPLGYLEFNYLVKHAKCVITDSGGVTEETTVMGVPCLTMRDSTERPETITLGTNELIGSDPSGLEAALDRVMAGQWKKGSIPEKWDGHAGERIVAELECLLR
ncbi:MAG: UDP-N-acetylglucosamine 2-epimerase (non-hydrolyzing) [Vicinamibacterales bacterium]